MERVRRTLWILWGSFVASSALFGVVCAFIPHPEGKELDAVMLVLLLMGLASGGATLLGGRMLADRLDLMAWCIIRWALGELPAALGLALWVLGAPGWAALGACAFGVAVNLLQAPSDSSLEAWAGSPSRCPDSSE